MIKKFKVCIEYFIEIHVHLYFKTSIKNTLRCMCLGQDGKMYCTCVIMLCSVMAKTKFNAFLIIQYMYHF